MILIGYDGSDDARAAIAQAGGSLLLGSVSHAVLQHADRTVVVAPSPSVAQRRHARRGEHVHTQTAASPV
ncbi:MAG TPA: hypothetical protein VFW09_16240 [Solirubrobacteraceae bacterium]|nr:hypothetical protein [Solirubrobacteraceae bacterium]